MLFLEEKKNWCYLSTVVNALWMQLPVLFPVRLKPWLVWVYHWGGIN